MQNTSTQSANIAATDSFISQVAKSFGHACNSYVSAARLQQQVALDALDSLVAERQGVLLDLGCGPGWLHPRLLDYCQQFTAVDLSAGMLAKAAQLGLATDYIQADAQCLPIPANSVDKVFSSLMLQWCKHPTAVFTEIERVLKPGGRVVMTTLLDGTLVELKQAFASLDSYPHVNQFLPVAALQNAAQQASGIRWQLEQRRYPLYYPNVQSLARELKALGAHQVADRHRQGLTGKRYWQQLAAAYEVHRTALGLPASYQVLLLTGVKDAR